MRATVETGGRDLLYGMPMASVKGTTELTGDVIDRAQLHGVIERIEELGHELVCVEQTTNRLRY